MMTLTSKKITHLKPGGLTAIDADLESILKSGVESITAREIMYLKPSASGSVLPATYIGGYSASVVTPGFEMLSALPEIAADLPALSGRV